MAFPSRKRPSRPPFATAFFLFAKQVQQILCLSPVESVLADAPLHNAWQDRAKAILDHPEQFFLSRENCLDLVRAAEFTQQNFGSAWTSGDFINFYTNCVEELKNGKLDEGKDRKSVAVGGVHFPTVLTSNHRTPPISRTWQDKCWPGGTHLDVRSCCEPGPASGCFDDFFTYDTCCLGKIERDVPHHFLAPAMDMNVGNAVRHWGTFDLAQSYAMQSFLNEGDVVLDIGANVGGFTVPLAEKVGVSGKVFAFEPFRLLFQQLTANVALNGLTNCFTFQHAIGESNDHLELYQPDLTKLSVPSAMRVAEQYKVGAEAKQQHLAYQAEERKELVDVKTLDTAIEALRQKKLLKPDQKINFMKIDVEFMEIAVVKGAKQLLTKDRPRIWVENEAYFDRENPDKTFVDLMEKEYNYLCKPVTHLELLCRPQEMEHSGFSKTFGSLMKEVNRVGSPHDLGWWFSLGVDYVAEGFGEAGEMVVENVTPG
ncbi:unnamed protein product [Amoebophrya sp. A120]|nr:unnamed protein product [Amoebophrya sp. A120]|eukprot:GSA120T00018817001.1